MADRITTWLGITALAAILIALVAFPPAGIVVAIAVGWWLLQADARAKRELREQMDEERRRIQADD